METMQPTLKSGRNTWDRINMPVEEFRERVKKIRKGMRKEGIDLLLLYGSGFNEYGSNNVFHFLGTECFKEEKAYKRQKYSSKDDEFYE